MNSHKPVNALIPGLGLRSLKTALSTAVLALLYLLFGGNPTFACIGVIFGMGNDMEESRKVGGSRIIGGIIGGLLGLAMFSLEQLIFPDGNNFLKVTLIFFGIILLVCASVMFKWPGAVRPGGVVLCIILFNTPAHQISYAFHRILDTVVGVLLALAVNRVFTRQRIDRWLGRDGKQ